MAGMSTLALLLVSYFCLVSSQSPLSSTISDGVITHIAVGGNTVYISTASTVYQLPANLQTRQQSSVSGTVLGLSATQDGQWLIVCTDQGDSPNDPDGTNNGACSALNGSTLTSTTVGYSGARTNDQLVVFTVPITGGLSAYTGNYGDRRVRYRQFGFANSSIMRTANEVAASGFPGRKFVGGFFTFGYAYYVALDEISSPANNFEIRIIRVCNDTANGLNNQYELELGCNNMHQFFDPSHISVSVLNGVTMLLGIHFSIDPNIICSYNISEINSMMDTAYQTCTTTGTTSRNIVWQSSLTCSSISGTICDLTGTPAAIGAPGVLSSNKIISNTTILSGLTSTIGLSIDGLNLVYFAFTVSTSHYIGKYLWNNSEFTLIFEVELMSPLNSLTWSDGSDYIYGINGTITNGQPTGNTVIGIKIEECSTASNCMDCVSLGDPLCGWCVVEGKCSRRSSCKDSTVSERYLTQGNTDSCITSISIDPPQYVLDTESIPHQVDISFSPGSLPTKLEGEEYFCVFNDIMTPLLNDSICSLDTVISQVTDIQLVTNFSIYSNRTDVNFIRFISPYIFYNCNASTKCSSCVNTGVCGWCQLDFVCRGQNTSCTGSNNWVSIQDEQTFTDICPFLLPNTVSSDGSYTQPVNVAKDLLLNTNNTEAGIDYECVYGSISRSAARISDNMVMCDIGNGQELTFSGGSTMTQSLPFSLRQTYNGNQYTIETSNTINVVLYDCPELATGCSSCLAQNINTGFNCSWCGSNQCTEGTVCASNVVLESSSCPTPNITNFDPKSGPPQGMTRVNITGTNLGIQESDIVSVTIGSRNCSIINYVPGVRIICTIATDNNAVDSSDFITVKIRTSGSQSRTATSSQMFRFLTATVESISPTLGPVSGGTNISVKGTNLDIGNQNDTRVIMQGSVTNRRKRDSHCPDVDCIARNITSNEIQCTSSLASVNCTRTVVVSINQQEFTNTTVQYTYLNDPTFTAVNPTDTIPAGGITLTFTGTNLDIIQSPMITINDSRFMASTTEQCASIDSTELVCTAPIITGPISDSIYSSSVSYKLILDGVPSPDADSLRILLKRDPIFTMIDVSTRSITIGQPNEISIIGNNIQSVAQSEINITFRSSDGQIEGNCDTQPPSDTEIDCTLPELTVPDGITLSVQVTVGRNLVFPPSNMTESQEWRLEFASSTESVTIAVGIGSAAAGVILLTLIVAACIIFPVICYLRHQYKKKDLRFTTLLNQMENMEVELADQCKQAFAELQTDLGELVTDETLDIQQLPFHDFPTYATKVFFPSASTHHPVLQTPRVPPNMTDESLCVLLDEFKELIFDKKFLLAFIRTLEAQPKFSVHEKSSMASLLMVACLKDLSYATEILQTLLTDLIRRSVTNAKSHPKLLLRRTESVAEKLLTNWFCVALYPYLREHAGAPLFVLFKAVKAQLEKGPIDVITGEARNSLSEEKLLRQNLDFKVMECEVEMGNCNLLLKHTKIPEGVGVDPVPCNSDEIQTVKLLDTDSISQAKEKLLDYIYRNRPVSLRPSIGQVELELCRGNAGIPLKDQDTTSKREGEWMKINTLGHFNIPEMAEAASEDPKKPTPRFRLTPRPVSPSKPGRPLSGPIGYDVPGTIVASASITSQTSLLAALPTQTFDTNTRLFHLVKPEYNDGEQSQQKIVSEVFLTRLLSTKRILQKYVDDLFNAIFTVPHGKPLPKAIKILFDFLDYQAAVAGVNDPEVLHTWKTNTLPLRFWVNLIKNPDFVFDINKSATVDSCFTVIAQAYIDACSTAEVRYTKDTPSARLLYANEVKQYKSQVLQYYSRIQSLPPSSSEETKTYFDEMVETYFKGFESKEGIHFHSDSALLEMYRYAVTYGDQIMETLTEERLTLMAAQFNNLRQKYNVELNTSFK